MTCLLALIVTVSAADQDQNDVKQLGATEPPPRLRLHEVEKQLTSLLKREAKAPTNDERIQTVRELIHLHEKLSRDERLFTSEMLNRLRNRLRSRLRKVAKTMQRELARSERHVQFATRSDRRVALHETSHSLGFEPTGDDIESLGAFGGGRQPADNGQALVDLIQRTIAPDTWDVNGGSSTIVYYAPRYALVVRAPAEIQRGVARGLNRVRRAGQ